MFTRSHLQEMKRRYASMYAPSVEEEIEEHCGVCGEQGIEEVEVAESFELQATMALDDAGIKSKWKKGKLYVAKRDIKKAEKALGKSFKKMKKGAEPDLYYEEVEIDESLALQLKMAFDDAKIKMKSIKGKIVIAKKDKKKAMDALSKTLPSKLKKYVDKAVDNFLVFEEVELDEKEAAYPSTIENLRKIVKDKQNQIFMFDKGQARVDLFSASAIIAVYDGMKKPELKKKLEDMIKTKEGFLKTQAFAMKMVK